MRKVPKLKGIKINKAKEILEEEKIEYKIKKRISLFTRINHVIETTPEEGKEIEKGEVIEVKVSKLMILPLIVAIIIMVMIPTITVIVKNQKPSAPVIDGSSEKWVLEDVIYVKKDAKVKEGIDYYEYCMRKSESTKECEWKKTTTKNMVASKTGIWYITFRGISKEGKVGRKSNTEKVYIDNESPYAKEIKKEGKKIKVIGKDDESGVEKIYYKINKGEYEETTGEIDLSKLKEGKYEITIKIVDKVGNESEVIARIEIKEEKVEIEESPKTEEETKKEENESDKKEDEKNNEKEEEENDKKENESDKKEEEPKEEEKVEAPRINLNEVPVEMSVGESHELPSYYWFDKKGGEVSCRVNEKLVTNTKELGIGEHIIKCEARGNNGLTTKVEKKVTIKALEGEDAEFEGWIRMNLYYPEESTEREWRLATENGIRDGSNNSSW